MLYLIQDWICLFPARFVVDKNVIKRGVYRGGVGSLPLVYLHTCTMLDNYQPNYPYCNIFVHGQCHLLALFIMKVLSIESGQGRAGLCKTYIVVELKVTACHEVGMLPSGRWSSFEWMEMDRIVMAHKGLTGSLSRGRHTLSGLKLQVKHTFVPFSAQLKYRHSRSGPTGLVLHAMLLNNSIYFQSLVLNRVNLLIVCFLFLVKKRRLAVLLSGLRLLDESLVDHLLTLCPICFPYDSTKTFQSGECIQKGIQIYCLRKMIITLSMC